MPDPEVIDPSRPTPPPNGNGQQYYSPADGPVSNNMTPAQIIQMILQNGFAGWKTPIALTRPTQRGPEKYETTPAKLMAENTQAMLALNHTLNLFLQGVVPCETEDEHGQTVLEEVNPIQAIVDLTAALDESITCAEKQLGRKSRRKR